MATKNPSPATETKPGLRKPVFVKVDSLKPGTNGHTLTVKVVNANTVLNKKPRNPGFRGAQNGNSKIAECLVGDETGCILFTARNDQGITFYGLRMVMNCFTAFLCC